ncbi:MAG: hypothetical protein M0Z66_06550 [Thermaerobacter sp.]|nr:hypothetical protein [Thermaerobacter sp.]
MRRYIRGLMTGGLIAAGLVMWLQSRRRRRRFMYLGARSVAQAAQGGRRWLARAGR